jgi:hypothetical protein
MAYSDEQNDSVRIILLFRSAALVQFVAMKHKTTFESVGFDALAKVSGGAFKCTDPNGG